MITRIKMQNALRIHDYLDTIHEYNKEWMVSIEPLTELQDIKGALYSYRKSWLNTVCFNYYINM